MGVALHRGHRLTTLTQDDDGVTATFETVDGPITRRFGYLVAPTAPTRRCAACIGMPFDGYTFDDRFLIADIRADLPYSSERHFHFDPPWNPGRQVLIHPQPDGVWRIDWQVPPETDAEAERLGGGLDRRIREVVGERTPYELVWLTAYRFSQRSPVRFREGRVFLAGDAAHVMSPFGARGLNSGAADAENLAWRIAWALRHGAPGSLLDTYDVERRGAALENPPPPTRRCASWRRRGGCVVRGGTSSCAWPPASTGSAAGSTRAASPNRRSTRHRDWMTSTCRATARSHPTFAFRMGAGSETAWGVSSSSSLRDRSRHLTRWSSSVPTPCTGTVGRGWCAPTGISPTASTSTIAVRPGSCLRGPPATSNGSSTDHERSLPA
jgi:hypothetical protein